MGRQVVEQGMRAGTYRRSKWWHEGGRQCVPMTDVQARWLTLAQACLKPANGRCDTKRQQRKGPDSTYVVGATLDGK
jgi:hypothetical protein